MKTIMIACAVACLSGGAAAATLVVCPEGAKDAECRYAGDGGIQAAVDQASDGDIIRIRAGTYRPAAYRDVTYREDATHEYVIRGYVVIADKELHLIGEPGAILDGGDGLPASAMVVDNGAATIENLTLRGFHVASSEDDLYDGHGLFIIDSQARIKNVTVERVEKMALSIRGNSLVDASQIHLADSHLGIWIEEESKLELENAVVRNSESAGIAAYDRSSSKIRNALFENNGDDGVYAEGRAFIDLSGVVVVRNKPYGIRAVDESRITADASILFANEKNFSDGDGLKLDASVLTIR